MADSDKPAKTRLPVLADIPVREDMDDGLRFTHIMGMQTKHDLFEASTRVLALLEELVAQGQLDLRAFDDRREEIKKREAERIGSQATVQVGDMVDKYELKDTPVIDCKSIIPICKAKCCTLYFPLTFQDLDEKILQWDYSRPYLIRKKPNIYCVHNEENGTYGCSVYANRPAICRVYDCRRDKRIWTDFEKKILAPDEPPKYGRPPPLMSQ